jgi:hypothetical protein
MAGTVREKAFMGKENVVRAILGLMVFLMAGPRFAHADIERPPRSYKVVSSDQRFVFVMLVSIPQELDGERWPPEQQREAQETRSKYRQSGLYRNDGSTTPIWTVDWYARSVRLLPYGIHLIRSGRWPSRTRRDQWIAPRDLEQEAFNFFADGKLLRRYLISELVHETKKLQPSTSHFGWLDRSEVDDERKLYTVVTLDGYKYELDVRTGDKMSTEGGVKTISPVYPSTTPHDPKQAQESPRETEDKPRRWEWQPRMTLALMPMMFFLALGGLIFLICCVVRFRLTRKVDEKVEFAPDFDPARLLKETRDGDSGQDQPDRWSR